MINRIKKKNLIATLILSLLALSVFCLELAFLLLQQPAQRQQVINYMIENYRYLTIVISFLGVIYFYHAVKLAKRKRKFKQTICFFTTMLIYVIIILFSLVNLYKAINSQTDLNIKQTAGSYQSIFSECLINFQS